MKYLHIHASRDGESHMEVVEVAVAPVNFVPGEPPVDLSTASGATGMMFYRLAAGWAGGWHPTPRRQFAMIHVGAMEIETSDGRKHLLRTGDVVMFEDTSGKGHRTRIPERDCWGIGIALAG